VRMCRISPHNQHLCAVSDSGVLTVWDAPTGTQLYQVRNHSTVALSCDISCDGRLVASAGADGRVVVCDLASGSMTSCMNPFAASLGAVCSFSPTVPNVLGCAFALPEHKSLVLAYDLRNTTSVEFIGLPGHMHSLTWLATGTDLVTADSESNVCTWRLLFEDTIGI